MKKTMIALTVLMLALPLAVSADPNDPQPQQAGDTQQPCPMMGMGMQMGGPGFGMGMGPGMGRFGHGRGDRDGDGPECILNMAKNLGLSDQQIEQIKKLRHDFQLQQIDRRAEIDKAELAMRELRRNDKAGESEVLAQIDKLGQLRTQEQKAMYSHHRAMQNVLTEEQRTKLREMRMKAWDDDDTPGMGRGGMRGPGKGMGCGVRCGR